ncbi:MAG: MoaD/ThiS family protein [Anaerolineales bacterium]|nr:MoaD/ThiS family protein [Anaerolineales bacterium]
MMITVHVRYFNFLAVVADARQAEITIPADTTLRQFIHHLAEMHSERFRSFIFDGQEISTYLRIFHNEKLIWEVQLDDIRLAEGDEIMLFPAIAGG